jgi:hypothetical protein
MRAGIVLEVGGHDEHRDPLERRGVFEHLEELRPIHLGHAEVQHDQLGDDGAYEV